MDDWFTLQILHQATQQSDLYGGVMTNEQLQNINKTLIKQRDDAELKVAQLVRLIEDDLWVYLDKKAEDRATIDLKKIGV